MTISTFLQPTALKTDLLNDALAKMYIKYRNRKSKSSDRQSQLETVEYVLRYPLPAKRHVLHQLLCIDTEFPYDDATMTAVEAFLAYERSQIAPESFIDPQAPEFDVFPNPKRDWQSIAAWKGDMLRIKGDEQYGEDKWAIVNPANNEMLGCFQPQHRCLDNQIHAAAGPRVRQECYGLKKKRPVPTGVPIITGTGILPFGHIIHVAGPMLERRRAAREDEVEKLRNAYKNSLSLALKNDIENIAFPCISTGLFNFPSEQAAEVATQAVADWFEENKKKQMKVVFMLWTDNDIACYDRAMARTFPNIPEFQVRLCNTVPSPEIFDNIGGLIIHAGAGLSADAVGPVVGMGLDYTSRALFSKLYPGVIRRTPLRTLYDMIGYEWDDQWGFMFAHAHRVLNWGKTPVYSDLLRLVSELSVPYTIMTSNADQLFFQSGFDPERIFTPQGCYARFQCLAACSPDAYFDSLPWVERAVPHLDLSDPQIPEGMEHLIPQCEKCGGEVFFNVRGGGWFLETPYLDAESRYKAAVQNMAQNAQRDGKRVVVLELGSGFNTPTVIRYPSEALGEVATVLRVNKEHPEIHSQVDSARGYKMGAVEFLRGYLGQRERTEA